MAREYGTDPYGILARGAPSAGSTGRGIGGSGFSVGTVGIPMADVSRAPGNSVGTGRGVTFSIGSSGPKGNPQDFGRNANVKKKAKGGSVKSSASKRADGCATKGKTRGKFV